MRHEQVRPATDDILHYTSCTVGIDEVERYHHPKDLMPDMMRRYEVTMIANGNG
jgi:hypothetical protein